MDHPIRQGNLGFTSQITRLFGPHIKNTITRYMSTNQKLANLISKRIFLLQCKTNNIIPTHIKNACKHIDIQTENPRYSRKMSNLRNRTEKTILNTEIKECHWTIKCNTNLIKQLTKKLNKDIPQNLIQTFTQSQNKKREKLIRLSNNRLKQKLSTLQSQQSTNPEFIFDENCVKNISDENIPVETTILLSLGPKFNMPTTINKMNNALDLIASTEKALNDITDIHTRDETRRIIANEIHNHTKKQDNNRINKFLRHCEFVTNKFLKQNRHLYIVKSDKGNLTTIMTKRDYMTKMEHLLSDVNTYISIDNDPTPNLQKKNNKLVSTMENKNYINKLTRKQLLTDTAVSPRMYGLPKTHKPNIPMRPVTSNINSPSYKLSKYIHNILQKINKDNKYNVKNAKALKEFLSTVSLRETDTLLSLDVESLYTNVDMELVFEIIDSKWNLIEDITPIDKTLFKEIIKFCVVDCNYFSFNEKFFKQKYGLAMGNPLSSVLAEMALDFIIDEAIKKLPLELTFLKKYVDDIICAVPSILENQILDIFNNTHNRFKFTMEKEQNNSIPFLDMLIIRNPNQKLITDWYCKPCSANRILNFYSNHPHHTKMNTIQAYTNNIIDISDSKFVQRNIKIITDILTKNNYPKHIINSVINRATRRKHFYNNNETQIENNTPRLDYTTPIYTSLPFINNLSLKIARIIKRNNDDIKIALKPINKLENKYSKVKDKIPDQDKNCVVYEVQCEACNKIYIGQTSKKLRTRLSQHKAYINKKTPHSALASHAIEKDHNFAFDEAKIITIENNKRKREMKEACHIHINKNRTVNLRRDTEQINQEYRHILKNLNPSTYI